MNYLHLRGDSPGPVLLLQNAQPLSRSKFCTMVDVGVAPKRTLLGQEKIMQALAEKIKVNVYVNEHDFFSPIKIRIKNIILFNFVNELLISFRITDTEASSDTCIVSSMHGNASLSEYIFTILRITNLRVRERNGMKTKIKEENIPTRAFHEDIPKFVVFTV